MGNVVEMPVEMWNGLKRDVDAMEKHKAAYRSYWPTIARRMATLREQHASDNAFGAALVAHGIELNKDDRAAFIEMGKWADAYLEDMMANIARMNPRLFIQEAKEFGGPRYKKENGFADCETDPTTLAEPEKQPEQHQNPEKTDDAPEQKTTSQDTGAPATAADRGEFLRNWFAVAVGNGPRWTKMSSRALKALHGLVSAAGAPACFGGKTISKFSVRIFYPDLASTSAIVKESTLEWDSDKLPKWIDKYGARLLEAYSSGVTSADLPQWWHRNIKVGTPTQGQAATTTTQPANVTAYRMNGTQVWPTFVAGMDSPAQHQVEAENAIAFWMRLNHELMTSAQKDEKSAAHILSQLLGAGARTSLTQLAAAIFDRCNTAVIHGTAPGDTFLPNTREIWSRNVHK